MVIARAQQPAANPPAAKKAVTEKSRAPAFDQPAPAEAQKLPGVIAVPGPVPQARDEPTFEDLLQDASASYRPFVISELRFTRKACGLSALELKPIVQEAARLLKDVSTKAAKAEQKNRQNLGKVMQKADDSGPEPTFDPLTPISRGLARIVRAHVSPAQWSRFEDETATRRAHRTRVAINNLVALLDFHLLLSHQQRSLLSGSLASHWDEAWNLFVVVTSDNDDQQIPPIPDDFIVPILTETQKKIWARFSKEPRDASAGLLEVASDLAGEQESEFDSELGKPRIEVNLGDVHVE
jgi:hypothetical protein